MAVCIFSRKSLSLQSPLATLLQFSLFFCRPRHVSALTKIIAVTAVLLTAIYSQRSKSLFHRFEWVSETDLRIIWRFLNKIWQRLVTSIDLENLHIRISTKAITSIDVHETFGVREIASRRNLRQSEVLSNCENVLRSVRWIERSGAFIERCRSCRTTRETLLNQTKRMCYLAQRQTHSLRLPNRRKINFHRILFTHTLRAYSSRRFFAPTLRAYSSRLTLRAYSSDTLFAHILRAYSSRLTLHAYSSYILFAHTLHADNSIGLYELYSYHVL